MITLQTMKNQSLVKKGSNLSILTFISRILGLVREMTKAAFLGTSALSDAFSLAFMIPNLLRRLFAENSISVAFIPTFRHYLDTEKKDTIKQFLSSTFTIISFLTTITVLLGISITPLIIPFFGTVTDEAILLTRIMFPYLAIISIAAFFQGILNGIKVFSPSGFTPILFNIIVIGLTWLLSPILTNPARAMAVGVLVGGTTQALFQLPFVLKNGFNFSFVRLSTAFKNPGTRTVLKLIGPTIIGMAAYQLNDLVSTFLASNAGEGILSSLQYSLRLQELILGIFAVSIGTVILPDLSGYVAKQEWADFNSLLAKAMNIIALITIPVTFYSLISAEGLISLLFKTRNFADESVKLTLQAFTWHIVGLFFIAQNRIISPSFYAQKDSSSPTISGIASFVANMFLAMILVKPMKGGGIALALSLSSLINTCLLFIFLRKKKHVDVGQVLKKTVKYSLKILIFSSIASIPLILIKNPLYARFESYNRLFSQGIPLCLSLLLFVTVGGILLLITKDPLLFSIIKRLKKTKN